MVAESEKCAHELPCPEVLRRLNEANWDRILPELVLYAQFKLECILWPGGHAPGGTQAEDLVQEAIASLFSGQRTWNVAKHPDLEVVLKGIIKSLVNHLTKTKDNKTRQALSVDAGVDGWGHEALSNEPSPDESLAAADQIEQIESLLEDDEEAGMVFLWLQEEAKPKEIAEELDKPVTEIYVIKRRIRRKLQDNLRKKNEVD